MPTVPSVEAIPSSLSPRRNSVANIWNAITHAERNHIPGEPSTMLPGQVRRGSKGFLTARMPQARAARSTGRKTCGNICVCLWLSKWVTVMSRDWILRIWASVSRWISSAEIRRRTAATANSFRLLRKRVDPLVKEVRPAETGSPSMSTTWQPVFRLGCVLARSAASLKARALAMIVAEVSPPELLASEMARFTPEVRPKSSALMMRRRTEVSLTEGHGWLSRSNPVTNPFVLRTGMRYLGRVCHGYDSCTKMAHWLRAANTQCCDNLVCRHCSMAATLGSSSPITQRLHMVPRHHGRRRATSIVFAAGLLRRTPIHHLPDLPGRILCHWLSDVPLCGRCCL